MEKLKPIRVAFFGASVTKQKNGYCDCFAKANPNFKVRVFGYGSMHIFDAGVCYIDDVLEFEPDYCFIDWLATGYIKNASSTEIKEYINTIIYRFFTKKVKLIFLIFPNKKYIGDVYRKIVEVKNYLIEQNIPVIDLYNLFDNLDDILRDAVHTTEHGSKQYSRIIAGVFLKDIFNKYQIPKNYPSKNKFCVIKRLILNKNVREKIIFCGKCTVLGISQLVGPYSGLVAANDKKINNWDRWCYYERETLRMGFKVDGITTLKVLQDDFDRSSCEHECNWEPVKYLKLQTVFYIGKKLVEKSSL